MSAPNLPTFRAVIFDMDGLLLDSERIVKECWERASSEVGYSIPDSLFRQLIGRNSPDSRKLILDAVGHDFPLEEVGARCLEYEEDYLQEHGMPVKPGAVELIEWLIDQDIDLSVATSTRRKKALARLEMANLLPHFKFICAGDQVAKGKPAPDLFWLAAERMRILPNSCLVLEDAGPGVHGAYAAGMTPLLVPDLVTPDEETRKLAWGVFDSLHDVLAKLEAAAAE
ncbi:MAG: HAD family phosphatase [Pseudomonadota bacterium]